VGVRVGQYLLTPNTGILPIALAFFVVISYRRLQPYGRDSRVRPIIIMLAAVVSGIAGGWLHARLFPVDNAQFPNGWLDVRFGSFGGYWGAFLGAIISARIMGMPGLPSADALVPGVLIGGVVARVGCLFTGCCQGIDTAAFGGFQPFRHWPLFDLLALLATAGIAHRAERKPGRQPAPGIQLGLCLAVYGALRFILEFARALPQILGTFTSAQILAACQVLAGLALLILLSRERVRPPQAGD